MFCFCHVHIANGALAMLLVVFLFCACRENARPAPSSPLIVKDSTTATRPLPDSTTQTPYTCAIRSLRAMEQGDLQTLTSYVHPVKGLTVNHLEEYIADHGQTFSIAELNKELVKPTVFTIVNGYEEELKRKSTLPALLRLYATSKNQPDDATRAHLFSATKDVRRNYIGNGSYTLDPPLAAGQTTIAFHLDDDKQEMNWQELVLRTETYQGKDYLVEILRANWTP